MDSLRKRVLERDKKHNSPRQMQATTRELETKSICLACRRVPDTRAMRMYWYQQNRDDWGYQKEPWPGLGDVCPDCDGQLVSITW